MFLDILEFTVENKKNCLGKTVVKMWSQMLTKSGSKVHKTTFRKKCENQKKLKLNKTKDISSEREKILFLLRFVRFFTFFKTMHSVFRRAEILSLSDKYC